MRIGNLEIRWAREGLVSPRAPSTSLGMTEDYTGALAVADTEPWWRAVHQIINEAERETIVYARQNNTDPNACLAAVNAGDGIDLVRRKLNDARKYALSHFRAGPVKSKREREQEREIDA